VESKYFNREEFTCKCGCGFNSVDAELLTVLEELREEFDSPVTINSGCRCVGYNKLVGGSAESQHTLARAADIVVAGVHPQDVYLALEATYPEQYGMGNYNTFTHIDTRDYKARW